MKTYRQRGTSAIELSIIITATFVLLPAVALFAMVFFQYSVMKTATHDAAMYMSTLSHAAVVDDNERNRAIVVAQRIVSDAALDAGMTGLTSVAAATVLCDGATCIDSYPDSIEVNTQFTISDRAFSFFTHAWTSRERRTFKVIVTSTVPLSRK